MTLIVIFLLFQLPCRKHIEIVVNTFIHLSIQQTWFENNSVPGTATEPEIMMISKIKSAPDLQNRVQPSRRYINEVIAQMNPYFQIERSTMMKSPVLP